MSNPSDHIKQLVARLPEKPGVYQYFNKQGEIIYVGKAKNLRRRVSSYFQKEHEWLKTRQLVAHIADLKYVVVDSEQDAFLLENSLIKQYQPHYNIMLKDGKSYPSICITREDFPRIFKTRKILKGVGEYFGPYSYGNTVDLESVSDNLATNLTGGSDRLRTYIGQDLSAKQSVYLHLYEQIRNCNIILGEYQDGRDTRAGKNIIGTCYAIRGVCYYQLLRMF